ncbi:RNA polymerase sigma factor [Patescibacteria group bacterium]
MSKVSMDLKKEKRLIELARKDKKHFGPLYKHYVRHIMKYFSFRLNNNQIAEELTSQTFEKALKGLDNFQWQGVSFSAWLYRIARNTLVDYYRKNEKRSKVSSLDDTFEPEGDSPTPPEQVEIAFEQEYLHKLLNELPQRDRDIIYMKFFDGYTNRVIAKTTGLSETNVGTIVYRAIRKLREMY